MESAREVLLAERERALRRVAALEGDFDGIVEAAGSGGTDDEHDPEGATLAFERQHAAALLGEARERIAEIEGRWADGRPEATACACAAGSQSGMTDWLPVRRRRPASAAPPRPVRDHAARGPHRR